MIAIGQQYYHPFTRVEPIHHAITVDGGEIITRTGTTIPATKTYLTPEQIVEYYYKSCGRVEYPSLKRDAGAVNFLIRELGLDLTLFAIDCLVTEYYEGERRSEAPPDIIKARDFSLEAKTRRGQIEAVWKQRGVAL